MLEQDYLNENRRGGFETRPYKFDDPRLKELNTYSSQLIRELIIPKLIKEVNTSKRYAPLRQVYYSLILASWFKARNPQRRGGLITRPYGPVLDLIDSKDLTNLTSKESWSKDTYFNAYKENFTKGEYNIQEPIYTPYGQTIRSYFSGGVQLGAMGLQGSIGALPEGATFPLAAVQDRIPHSESNIPEEVSIDPQTREIKLSGPSDVPNLAEKRRRQGGLAAWGWSKDNSKQDEPARVDSTRGGEAGSDSGQTSSSSPAAIRNTAVYALIDEYKDMVDSGFRSTEGEAVIGQARRVYEELLSDLVYAERTQSTKELNDKWNQHFIERPRDLSIEEVPEVIKEVKTLLERIAGYRPSKVDNIQIDESQHPKRSEGVNTKVDIQFLDAQRAIKQGDINLAENKVKEAVRLLREVGFEYDAINQTEVAIWVLSQLRDRGHADQYTLALLKILTVGKTGRSGSTPVSEKAGGTLAAGDSARPGGSPAAAAQARPGEAGGGGREDMVPSVRAIVNELVREFGDGDSMRGLRMIELGFIGDSNDVNPRSPFKWLLERGVDIHGIGDQAVFGGNIHKAEYAEYLARVPSNSQDAIFSHLSLYLRFNRSTRDITDPSSRDSPGRQNAFPAIARVLKPGGLLILVVIDNHYPEDEKSQLPSDEELALLGLEKARQYDVDSEYEKRGCLITILRKKKNTNTEVGDIPGVLNRQGGNPPAALISKPIATSNNAKGGIDFRSLPIVTQAIGNLRMNMDMQAISRMRSANVRGELEEIQRMVDAGIAPSGERIKEYVQASSVQGNLDVDKVISCISDILRLEEERCCATEARLRDILVVLESARSSQELKEIFVGKI